jgi:uncharacterized protein (TIGR01777 family)
MRIFITGSTGFIGRALVLRLQRDGHSIVAWVRDEKRAASRLGAGVECLRVDCDDATLARTLGDCDAVVDLAGESLIGRWTSARRARLAESRIRLTERLVDAIVSGSKTPRVLVSGSAVGYYGDRGDEVLTEDSAPADDFLAKLCQDWERAALRAEAAGVRVVLLRTGIVLGRDGGALSKLLTPFRLGLGGPIGSGRQYMPWIHLHDHVEIVATALSDARYSGPINATSPSPVTNKVFAKALGRALHRPAFAPLPGFVLKGALGDAASVLLTGQRAIPEKLSRMGFTFQYKALDAALADIVGQEQDVDIHAVEAA